MEHTNNELITPNKSIGFNKSFALEGYITEASIDRSNNLQLFVFDQIIVIIGDGNCQYRAVAYSLFNNQDLYNYIKQESLKFIFKNPH